MFVKTLMIAATTAIIAVPAWAADSASAPSAGETTKLEEVVVTARKRTEDILQTPVTVIALTSEDLTARGINSLKDIASATPGVNLNSNSSGRSDRTFAQFIIRGFTPSLTTASSASTFIDGVPIASATALQEIDDPERVEVLKGPQSAYFGRATFAGAVNVVTKEPTAHFGGSISAMVGTRDNRDVHAAFEGPILGDKLMFRATFMNFEKGGSYHNAADPKETLGDQQTTGGSLALTAKPIDGLTISAFGMLSEDRDGPAAQGLISAHTITNPAGQVVVPGQSNCNLGANPYFCGTAPPLSSATPASNDMVTPGVYNFLSSNKGRLISPNDGADGFGKVSQMYHAHLIVDYDFAGTGFKVTSLTGMNRERFSTLVDLDNYDSLSIPFFPGTPFNFPFLVEATTHDFSQEFRMNYDHGGPFRASAGVSYLDQWHGSGLGTFVFGGGSTVSGNTRAKTSGAFFGLSYDVLTNLTVDFEGRYQIDNLFAYSQPGGTTLTTNAFAPAGFYPEGATLLNEKFKNFVPRVIVKYNITPDVMTYASYSQGVNPGQFNTNFLTLPAAQQTAAAANGIRIGVNPEKVANYEVGLKGKFFDNRLRLASSIYYANWTDQIDSLGFPVLVNNVPQIISGTANAGTVHMKGVEVDSSALLFTNLTLNLAASYNDTDIKKYVNPIATNLTGITDFDGKQLPLTSKYSATGGAQYGTALAAFHDASWFVRADVNYKSGIYSNVGNEVKTPASTQVNFRLGFSQGPTSVEAFVTNAFNNTAYTTIADNFIFTPNFAFTGVNSALIVGLPDLRTYGLRLKYKF